ncbi:MAG: carboxypeptidase regulatory-like domain-containing protein [Bryobacteraceae bacterium]
MNVLKMTGCLILAASFAYSQNIYTTVNGSVVDPSGGSVAGAKGVLADQAKGTTRTFSTEQDGSFVVPNVAPGRYDVTIQAGGFKTVVIRDIVLTAGEVRSLGRIALEVGGLVESVTVEAQGTPVQVSSGERSGLVTGQQVNDIAVKGRDFASYLITVPGVVDTNSGGREAMARNALGGIHINGSRETSVLMMVDGMPSMDAGNNGVPDEPNMDAIAEVKIMASNYQAEYGRNAGGLITIVTKSGSKNFSGSAYDFYRHESLNANDFFNNRTGTKKAPYRYRITGYSIGGPVLLPKLNFNRNRDKLFFFFSQELVGSRNNWAPQFINTPTQLERNGDFSRSFDVNGALIPVKDPTTGQVFPGNVIPKDRINKLGQAMLNFLPLPNYTDPDPANLYRRNYRTVPSGGWPRRQEVVRVDYNITPSFQVFYRLLEDANRLLLQTGSGGWPAGSLNYLLSPVMWDRPARAQAIHATNVFSPTLVNEVTFTRSFNNVITYATNPSVLDRSLMGNPAQWFKDERASSMYIPALTFGGTPVNTANTTLEPRLPDQLPDPGYTVTENLSKVWRNHSLKAGVYVEWNNKIQSASSNIRGAFSFARDTNNPIDTGHGYANALIGNFQSYSEATRQPQGNYVFWDVEWYVQDNWRVSRKLTLDLGLRLYHMPPTKDRGGALATFIPSLYDASKAPALYMPARDASNRRVAKDPRTGALAPFPLIGLFVPNSGDYSNGSRVAGDGIPKSLYSSPWLGWAPRFGFAYDVFGNGKTAIRGGFGVFKDKVTGNTIYSSAANPPAAFTPTLYYGTLDTYAQNQGVVGPSAVTGLWGHHPLPSVMNYSFSIQHQLRTTTFDVAYVGSLARHLSVQRNINAIPMFARFDPKNMDPTQSGVPLQDNFFRPYSGYGNINQREFTGTSNYHSLQVSAARRFAKGVQFGVAYTWSKTLTVSSGDNGGLTSYFSDRSWNYGPANFDQPHTLVFNYIYDLPGIGARTGVRPLKWVLDNWQISGITSFMSGNPFTPGFTTVDGQEITGSSDGARITVVGNPKLEKSQKTFNRTFNTDAFRRTPQREFGNAGVGILYGPGINNWDLAISKRFPLFSERRYVQFRTEMFNAFNHTQFAGQNATARFDRNGVQTDPNFGAYTSTMKPRIIQLSLRLMF